MRMEVRPTEILSPENRKRGPESFAQGGANAMNRTLIFAILVVAATVAQAQDIAGDWQGTLNTGAGELRLVLHITKAADGALKATLDSVDQGANGIPVSSLSLKSSKLSLGVDAVHGTYE